MTQTFVIPDIHGRLDLLSEAFAEIAAPSKGETGTIVMIGDYVDKGPDSKGVIDRLLSGVSGSFELVTLKGNHDAMMIDALRDRSTMANWLAKGGDAGPGAGAVRTAGTGESHLRQGGVAPAGAGAVL